MSSVGKQLMSLAGAAALAAVSWLWTAPAMGAQAPADAPKPAEKADQAPAKADDKAAPKQAEKGKSGKGLATDRPTRVAVLPFGVPRAENKYHNENGVGSEVIAKHWEDAFELLKKDNVDVVVVRVNSPGGYLSEVPKFHKIFQKYKANFRTVVWNEWAISAAAMSPWIIEEMYFTKGGVVGGATAHMGGVVAVKGIELDEILYEMEKISNIANRDIKVVKAMQIMAPLSANIDENGAVTFFQDLTGQHIINPAQRVLTITSQEAIKYRIGIAEADTLADLMKVMGIKEWEQGGKEATAYVMSKLKEADESNKKFRETWVKYEQAVGAAQGLQDRAQRGAEVGRARQLLNQIRGWWKNNPMLGGGRLSERFFREQEEMLAELMRR